jgi:DNA (cytosine-5)-methyltransferase 1
MAADRRCRVTAFGIDAIDGCAGPGGWSVAAAALGIREVGIELDPWACATRAAAGHLTMRADVAALSLRRMAGKVPGLIFSPPCGTFSAAGKGEGRSDMPLIHQALDDLAVGRDTRRQLAAACSDPRTPLVVEPLRYALAIHPQWIALEQVPAVLPGWQHCRDLLQCAGYSGWTGVLNGPDFGLGQQRRRAVLIASRVREVAPPAPTHSEAGGCDLLGNYMPPWRTMAEDLGWGYMRRPSPTVTGGGTATGGAEPFGNAARKAMRAVMADPGLWTPKLDGADTKTASHIHLGQADAARLQGFPDGYPFQGLKGQVALQVGNAFPPPMALNVLSAATGIPIGVAAGESAVAA